MPKSTETINQDLEDLLIAKGYEVTTLDSSGKEVPVASIADVMSFHFHRNGKDYGTVTVTIDGLQKLTVYYDDEIAGSGASDDSDREMNGTSWSSLVKQLKKFAQRHQLGFVLKDTDRLKNDMKRRVHNKQLEESVQFNDDLEFMSESAFEQMYSVTKKQALAEGGILSFMSKKQTPQKSQQPVDDYAEKLAAARAKKATTDEKVYRGPEEYYQDTGKHINQSDSKKMSEGDVDPNHQRIINKEKSKTPRVPKGEYDRSVEQYLKRKYSKQTGNKSDKQMKLDEGYYGNKKMSYSDDTPTVKMIIKHNRQLEETDQRFRHIESIFLETSDGERFKAPTTKPSRARTFARHIAEGGAYKDERWNHISEICEDLDKLGGFVRATHNKREQFNESAQRMISEATEQYQQLRETLKRIQSSRGYNKYFESYEPRVINENDTDLSEAFKHSSIDARIESALPTLNKFGIKMGKINEADMFAEWADALVNEALDLDSTRQVEELVELLSNVVPVGPNAEVAIGELNDIIEDDELNDRLRKAAKANPDSDARPQIIAWMQEQDNENYRRALEEIEFSDKQDQDTSNEENARRRDEKEKTQNSDDSSTSPELKEENDTFEGFKRLLGKK